MSKNLKTLWTVCLSLALLPLSAQEKPDTVYTFRFVPDRDMFYVPYNGNACILHVATRWHLGAGSNVQAAYAFPAGLQLGVYTGMAYLTGKPLDGTPEHLHKANYIWETGLKLGWSFGSKGKEDRQ